MANEIKQEEIILKLNPQKVYVLLSALGEQKEQILALRTDGRKMLGDLIKTPEIPDNEVNKMVDDLKAIDSMIIINTELLTELMPHYENPSEIQSIIEKAE